VDGGCEVASPAAAAGAEVLLWLVPPAVLVRLRRRRQ
jgi:hypothetical protein